MILSFTSCKKGELPLGTYETLIGGFVDKFVFTEDGVVYSFDDMSFEGTYEIKWGAFKDTITFNFDFEDLSDKEAEFATTLGGYAKPCELEIGNGYIIIADVKYNFVED